MYRESSFGSVNSVFFKGNDDATLAPLALMRGGMMHFAVKLKLQSLLDGVELLQLMIDLTKFPE